MPNYNNWLLKEDGHIITLALNRPETMNSLTIKTLGELLDICTYIQTLKDIRAVIIQGQGSYFSSGMDINEIGSTLEASKSDIRKDILSSHKCLEALMTLEKPTIAKIHGFCIGGGLLLASYCDFRIASQKSIFSLPEIKLGIPILWGTKRIIEVVGDAETRRMVLLGERFKANTALSIGLVHQVVPIEQLDETVNTLAGKFIQLPPRSVGIAKRIINACHDMTLNQNLDFEIESIEELLGSPDLKEAFESYREKRKPIYSGT